MIRKYIMFSSIGALPLLCAGCLLLLLIMSVFAGVAPQPDQSVQTGLTSAHMPQWVCPSSTPLPTIVKESPSVTPTYYDVWEQEYGQPVQTPTPYYKSGYSFFLGQHIEIMDGIFVKTTIKSITDIGEKKLSIIHLEWTNRSQTQYPLHYRQIVISSIKKQNGTKEFGRWMWTHEAAQLSNIPPSEDGTLLIDTGTTSLDVPILTPDGTITQIDLRLDPPEAQNGVNDGTLRIQFTEGQDTTCVQHEGVLTGLPHDQATAQAMPINPSGNALVDSALEQVGQQYCWGGKGNQVCDGYGGGPRQVTPACANYPCFDCSGLTWWAYLQNGITIGHGTANQQLYPQIAFEHQAPGDLALFTTINSHSSSGITHVGILGDINGDGLMDMVHASNYPDGVVIEMNVWAKSWYRDNLVKITRPPTTRG